MSRGPISAAGWFPHQLAIAERMRIPVTLARDEVALAEVDLVIDGLLGFSLSGAPSGTTAALIRAANAQSAPVLAIDLPSGLTATEGAVSSRASARRRQYPGAAENGIARRRSDGVRTGLVRRYRGASGSLPAVWDHAAALVSGTLESFQSLPEAEKQGISAKDALNLADSTLFCVASLQ